MTALQLTVVHASHEGAHHRSQRLMTEARAAADEHVGELQRTLVTVGQLAGDVSNGGDVYPSGVRDLAAKIAGDAAWCAHTMQSILKNTGRTPGLAEPEGLA